MFSDKELPQTNDRVDRAGQYDDQLQHNEIEEAAAETGKFIFILLLLFPLPILVRHDLVYHLANLLRSPLQRLKVTLCRHTHQVKFLLGFSFRLSLLITHCNIKCTYYICNIHLKTSMRFSLASLLCSRRYHLLILNIT